MKTILYYSLLLFGLLFGFSCQNNPSTKEQPQENITEATTENKEETAEESRVEEKVEKETEKTVDPLDGKARGLTKENVWEQLPTYESIEDFFKDKPTEIKEGELLALVMGMGAGQLNVFTSEELFDGIFNGARTYSGDAFAKVDLGSFYLIKLAYSSNMGGGEELMTWDKEKQLPISHMELSSFANTQYYELNSKTKMIGENYFESITKSTMYKDDSQEEKKTQFKFDPETGLFKLLK